MNPSTMQKLSKLATKDLETIVHKGENLHIPTSRASIAKRILESRRHAELVAGKKKEKAKSSASKELIIFYSWQSDLPNKTNRTLIENALEKAVKNIHQDNSIKIVPRIDKDTAGVSGSPNISATILKKIDNSFLVISDVSIINQGSKHRPCPNPNVIYELGWADKSIGMDKVIMVQNTAFGDPTKLPFDLKMRRATLYNCPEDGNISSSRKDLAKKLEIAIRAALKKPKLPIAPQPLPPEEFRKLLTSKQPPMILEAKLKNLVDQVLENLKKTNLYNYNSPVSSDEFMKRKRKVEEIMADLVEIFFEFGRWGEQSHLNIFIRQFEKIIQTPKPQSYQEIWENLSRYPALLISYAIGLGAIYNENAQALKALFSVKSYNRNTGENEPVWVKVNAFRVFENYKGLTKSKRYFPESDELFNLFKPHFKDMSTENYEDIFDNFEYFLSLNYGSWMMDTEGVFAVPTGSYAWRTQRRKIWETVAKDFNKAGEKWMYFICFDLDYANLREVVKSTNAFIAVRSVSLQ